MEDSDGKRTSSGPPMGGDAGEAPGDSLRGFLKRGEAFIEEILHENENLRLRIVQLESQLQEHQSPIPEPVAADELRQIFDQLRREHDELRRRLDEVASETEQYKARYALIEEENDRLVNLFVSAYQLHSTLEFSEVVQVIIEILLNFVGAGRFALLIWDSDAERFRPLQAYGLPVTDVPDYARDAAALGPSVQSGKPHLEPESPDGWSVERPRVCIPLHLGEEIAGLITIFSYLEQKEALSPIDQELFGLIGDHGGVVLESARLAAVTQPESNRFGSCVRLLNRGEDSDA